jgi:superfamily II DNA or RNA helicase
MNLRPYQSAARDAVHNHWGRHDRVLMVLPTGTGKTIVFSALAADAVDRGGRVLILAHRDELIRQAADKLMRSTGLACAIEKADECAADCMERVVVGSVQTLLNPLRRDNLGAFSHIIVDEAHHAISESYLSVLGHWDRAKVLGVTATPDRGDMRNLGQYFESLAFEYTLPQAIADGYLCKIKALTCPLKIDLNAVKVNGDLQANSLGTALEPYLPQIAAEIAAHCKDRKGMIFTPLCATAQTLQQHLLAAGVRAYYASGEDRSQIPAFEADGPGSVIINAMLLTEGYDHPAVDMISVLRMTKVRSLYAQMVGRGTRLAAGKDHLLLLDFLWNCERHQLCRPAHLIAEDADVAQAMTDRIDEDGGAMDLDAELVEQGKTDVLHQRESALAKKLAEMRHRKRELVDPLQYASSIGDPDLMTYSPALGAEAKPISQAQADMLAECGIYPGEITTAGHADAVLSRIEARRKAQMATPKHIRCLERFGFKHAGTFTFKYASMLIGRIRANGWRLPEDLADKVRKELESQ